MFENSSFFSRWYGEDAVRRNNRLRGLEFIGTPEFEHLFDELCILRDRFHPTSTPKVSIRIDDDDEEDIEINRQMKDNFRWKVEDDEDDADDSYEETYDKEPARKPPSIFEMLSSGKKFSDLVPEQQKHTEIYNQAFGLDDNSQEEDVQDEEDDEEEEEVPEVKNPFVFIANRLTFLAQTVQPIIFDTSLIETGSDYIKIALNEDKTFPKIRNFDELGLITCKLNCCQTIRDEIGEFIKGTEYTDIFCFPEFISRDGPGTDVWAIKFICYKRK